MRGAKILQLQDYPGGVAAGLRTALCSGRQEIVSAGLDPSLAFIGGDPWNTTVNAGLLVPATPTALLTPVAGIPIAQRRYLFMLARAQFNSGDVGTRLVGIRMYAELIARIAQESGPDKVFHQEITSPLFRPPDGSISWHVCVIPKTFMARMNPANADSFIFRDSYGTALLYENAAPYIPPNGGRPWGTPLHASLGNMHELRYLYRTDRAEDVLDVPLPLPCDVALFASVRQNDPATNPSDAGLSTNQFAALSAEEKFLAAFHSVAQYGRVAGSLVFDQNLGSNVP